MADETPSRITVSRDALRADLAEMELRLRLYFETQLSHKADKSDMAILLSRVLDLEASRNARDRGDFTPAQIRALDERIDTAGDARIDRGWTTKERWLAASSTAIGFSMLVLSLVVAIHGGV